MQESELIEIILLICILTIECSILFFSVLNFSQDAAALADSFKIQTSFVF